MRLLQKAVMRRSQTRTIVFAYPYYGAVPNAVSTTIRQLAGSLTESGDQVAVMCLRDRAQPPTTGEEIWGVSTAGLSAQEGRLARLLLEMWFLTCAIAMAAARRRRIAVMVTVDMPSGIGLSGLAAKVMSGGATRHICWVLDMFDDQVNDLGRTGRLPALGAVRRALNDFPYRHSDAIVTIGECMRKRIREKGGAEPAVIQQWQDRRSIEPRSMDAGKRKFGVEGRQVVLYSGHATFRHPLDGVLEAARRLADDPRILFVFVGQSDSLMRIEAIARREGLRNVERWDRVPEESVSDLLSIGDVHIISLAPRATGTCVPSKVYAAMAVARPAIFLGDEDCQAARDLHEAGAGFVADPADADAIGNLVKRLCREPGLASDLGRNGYEFFLRHRELSGASERWRAQLARVTGSPDPVIHLPERARWSLRPRRERPADRRSSGK